MTQKTSKIKQTMYSDLTQLSTHLQGWPLAPTHTLGLSVLHYNTILTASRFEPFLVSSVTLSVPPVTASWSVLGSYCTMMSTQKLTHKQGHTCSTHILTHNCTVRWSWKMSIYIYVRVHSIQLLYIKVPLTCKIFIAEMGSVLLVEKLRGTLSCKQWLHGGENRG